MFFMKGSGERPAEQSTLEAWQKGHLDNMGAQAKSGNLLAAGPLNDPGKERRGITVIVGKPKPDLEEFFKNDPFVKNKLMEPVAYKWDVPRSKFNSLDKIDPNKIVPHFLVLYTRGKGMAPENAEMWKEHEAKLTALKDPKLCLEGALDSPTWRRAAIFAGENREALEAALKESPLLKKSLYEAEIVPLWMSAGVVGE